MILYYIFDYIKNILWYFLDEINISNGIFRCIKKKYLRVRFKFRKIKIILSDNYCCEIFRFLVSYLVLSVFVISIFEKVYLGRRIIFNSLKVNKILLFVIYIYSKFL